MRVGLPTLDTVLIYLLIFQVTSTAQYGKESHVTKQFHEKKKILGFDHSRFVSSNPSTTIVRTFSLSKREGIDPNLFRKQGGSLVISLSQKIPRGKNQEDTGVGRVVTTLDLIETILDSVPQGL